MGTDGCPWGWWALFAALNLALIHSLGTPPVESWEVAYLPVCCSQELEWQLLRQTQWQGLQDLRLQVLQTLEETVEKLGNWGLGRHGMVEVEKEEGRNARWPPSRVHKNLLPQTPLWPPLTSPTPQSPAAEPLLPVAWPLLFSNLHSGAVLHPKKKEERASNNLKHQDCGGRIGSNKEEDKDAAKHAREFTYLCQQPLCLPFWESWLTPTSIQLWSMSMSSSSFVIGLLSSPFSSLESSEGEKLWEKGWSVNKYKDELVKLKWKQREGSSKYLCCFLLTPHPPAPPPSPPSDVPQSHLIWLFLPQSKPPM